MSFHQNGLTLTMFARDYTAQFVGPFTNLFFNIWSILSVIGAIAGCAVVFFTKKHTSRLIGAAGFLVLGIFVIILLQTTKHIILFHLKFSNPLILYLL